MEDSVKVVEDMFPAGIFVGSAETNVDGTLVVFFRLSIVYGLRVWDTISRSPVTPILKHADLIKGARFSPDSQLLASWGQDNTVRLWDLGEGGAAAHEIVHGSSITGVRFNKDGRRMLTWSAGGNIRVWRTKDGTPVGKAIKHQPEVSEAVFGPHEETVISVGTDGSIRLWNISTDYDFPKDAWPVLVEAVSGTTLDESGRVVQIPTLEWKRKRAMYLRIAREHLEDCQYPQGNMYSLEERW